MIIVEGSMQRLVEDAEKFFRSIRIIHLILALLMLGNGLAALLFSLGVNGDAKIPYYFSAFVASVWHVVFVGICQVCIHYLVPDRSKLRDAPTWVNVYTVGSSIFVIFNVMGIVFVIVNGLCMEGQACYYDKNDTANRSLAISLSFLHFVSIGLSVFLAKKSHLIDSQLCEDITIRVKHSFIWGRKRKASKVTCSTVDSLSLSEFSSGENVGGGGNSQDGAVVVATTATSWLDNKRVKINTHRSKSHPNLRRHGELNPHIEGTVVSIYSDTEERTDEGEQRKGKKRQVLSKRNRVTPTKSLRDSQVIDPRDLQGSGTLTTQCEIEINKYPLKVTIVDQSKPKLDSSTLQLKETGLLSGSGENSALPSVDSKSNMEETIATNQENILKQQQLLLQKQEQMQNDQKELLERQQQTAVQQQGETSAHAQTSGPITAPMDDVFLSPPPPYSETNKVAL